jgi:hypothetical protein
VVRERRKHRPAVPGRPTGLERVGDPQVDLRLASRREALAHRPAHELVREAVRETMPRRLDEEPRLYGLVHRGG